MKALHPSSEFCATVGLCLALVQTCEFRTDTRRQIREELANFAVKGWSCEKVEWEEIAHAPDYSELPLPQRVREARELLVNSVIALLRNTESNANDRHWLRGVMKIIETEHEALASAMKAFYLPELGRSK